MQTTKIFGTDGIRGTIGQGLMNPENLAKLGWAAGQMLRQQTDKPVVVIGKDTRISGYMLESALEAGLAYSGADIYLVGPIPTPALSFLTQELGADMGLMISASHNPFPDNGIKFFNRFGTKLDDQQEQQLSELFQQPSQSTDVASLGKAKRITDAATRYMVHCTSQLPLGKPLYGLKIVLDCANGAAYQVAPMIFQDLGATVVAIHNQPDGLNINDHCGSTQPQSLIKAVQHHQADCGIALDGDADRIVMVSDQGRLCDGDDLLYLLTMYGNTNNRTGVVGTLMTNMALETKLKQQHIPFHRTQVGDRFVAKELANRQWLLGGEPSGHIICAAHSKTGDGILAGLLILHIMKQQGASLTDLLTPFSKWPQALANINKPSAKPWTISKPLAEKIDHWKAQLGDNGRILLRESGTEPCIRIMVEAADQTLATSILAELEQQLRSDLGE